MAHYAFLDLNNIVTEVIVGKDEGEDGIDWEQHYGEIRGQTCKRTSYNTYGGVHKKGGTPYRKNYAGIGFTYDADQDAFIAPKPFDNWILVNWEWVPPIPMPQDTYLYGWNQETTTWDRGVSRPVIPTSTPYPDDGNEYYWDGLSSSWKPRTAVQHL
jgi:hypothetical protein